MIRLLAYGRDGGACRPAQPQLDRPAALVCRRRVQEKAIPATEASDEELSFSSDEWAHGE